MSHMPSFGNPNALPTGDSINVLYTITGSETNAGLDFLVPIGFAMQNTSYGVYWSPRGVTAVPFPDLPLTGRTTTQFRVLLGVAMTPGDVLAFLVAP